MTPFIDFYDYYLADINGCTYYAAENELRKAAQEFCQRTKASVVRMSPILLFAGIDTYEFDVEKQHVLVRLEEAKLDGKQLDILLRDSLSTGGSIRPLSDTSFQLTPFPSDGQRLEIRAIVKPSNKATGLDDELYAQYAEAISYGAKARLYLQPDKPYTNPNLAMTHKAMFDEAIGIASQRVAKSYSRAPLRTAGHYL